MKILIVEDDQSVAELERDYLEINAASTVTYTTTATRACRPH